MDPKNGTGRYSSDLIYGIKQKGNEVTILKENDDGFDGLSILKNGTGMFSSAFKIRKYLNDCDIIHALDVNPQGIIAYLANMFKKKKFILTAQGSYAIAPLYNWKTNLLSRISYKSADSIISISNYTKEELLKKVDLKNIIVVNHGVDLKKFHCDQSIPKENFILSVGNLKFRKGYHVSISAFAKIKEKMPNLKYKIVGSDASESYYNELEKILIKYNIKDDVEILKDISDEDLILLYQRAKLFILTSVNQKKHFEGFGLVFLEAAASGLPCIGTLGNGVEDAIKNNYNGILVPQNNIEQTSEALIKILSDVELLQKFSQNSLTWARQHTLESVADKYNEIYHELL